MAFEASPDCEAAMKDIRNDRSANDWALLGFESQESMKLIVLGCGSGGMDALREKIPDSDIAYGVLRKQYVYDAKSGGMGSTETTKFIRITWRPEAKLAMKRKMKIGTIDGAIKKILGSTHVDYEADDMKDLNDAAIVTLLDKVTQKADMSAAAAGKEVSSFYNSGNAVQARTAQGDKDKALKAHDAYLDKNSLTGGAKGAEVNFADEPAIKEAIQNVRNDVCKWMLAGYTDKKTIGLIGSGGGDVSEMIDNCKPATVCYGLFRIVEQIDRTSAVKFCFLTWQPDDVPVMMKASISTHRGAVLPMFRPYHVDFTVSKTGELDHGMVMEHVMSLSGTKSHVTDAKPQVKQDNYERKMLGGVKAEEVKIDFVDESAVRDAIKSVRLNSANTTWAVASIVKDGVKLAFQGSGSGGVDEFAATLCADSSTMSYGIIRLDFQVDLSTVTRFCFVTFQGKDTVPTLKAKIGTLRGGIVAVFHPYNAEVFVDSQAEVTEEFIRKRLS